MCFQELQKRRGEFLLLIKTQVIVVLNLTGKQAITCFMKKVKNACRYTLKESHFSVQLASMNCKMHESAD